MKYWLMLLLLMTALAQSSGVPAKEKPAQEPAVFASAGALGSGFEDRYATVEGVRIHYVVGGKGPAVLLVPGWPQTWWAWRNVMPELAESFTVIAVDTQGMGESSRPVSGYDMASIASQLSRFMQQLGYSRFHLVGHDIGAWISYAMAVDHPEALGRVAMLDSNLPGVTASPPVFLPKNDNTHSWHFMFNQLDDLPELLVEGRERAYLSWLLSNYAYRPGAVAMEEYIRAYSVPGAMRAGFAYYRALQETIKQNQARMKSRLPMPILALGGEYGTAGIIESTLRPYADDLRGGVLPECGHYVPEECPKALLEQLTPFLKGN